MFKWFSSNNSNAEQERWKCISISTMFDLIYDETEAPGSNHMDKVSKMINEKYGPMFSQIHCVNFTRNVFENSYPNVSYTEYGISTCFHYEQIINMLQLCHNLYTVFKTYEKKISAEETELYDEDDSIDENTHSNQKDPLVILFYCSPDNLYYALLMSACLIEFMNGVSCLEYYLQLTSNPAIEEMLINRPNLVKDALSTSNDSSGPSLMRYCKFFNLLIQSPMPYITALTFESISLNEIVGKELIPRLSSMGQKGKLYYVIKQNDIELYGGFFNQQSSGSMSSLLSENSQSATVSESPTGGIWYIYDLSKGPPIHVIGDFVICCYWVVRDSFTKVFRFTYNTMFLQTNSGGTNSIELTVPRSELDWVDQDPNSLALLPRKFVLKIHLKEKRHEITNAFHVIQTYRQELEKYIQECPFYYIKSKEQLHQTRLAHVIHKNMEHVSHMNSVMREYETKLTNSSLKLKKHGDEDGEFSIVTEAQPLDPSERREKQVNDAIDKLLKINRDRKAREGLDQISVGVITTENSVPNPEESIQITAPPPPPPPLLGVPTGMPAIPPPPPMGGIPPPPPSFLGVAATALQKGKKSSSMKRLDWVPIKQTSSESVWSEIPSTTKTEIDVKEFQEIFSQKPSTAPTVTAKATNQNEVSVLPSNLNRNIGIVMASQFKTVTDPKELIQKIMSFERLELAQLTNLLQFMISVNREQQTKLLSAGRNNYQQLPKSEQFLFHFFDKDRIQQQIETLIFMQSTPDIIARIIERLEIKVRSCNLLKTSEGFKRILHYVLTLGNIMNAGREKISNVSAFSLDILPKLEDTKASVNTETKSLMQYLANLISEKEEDVNEFYLVDQFEELVNKSAKISLSSLSPLIKQLEAQQKHFQKEYTYYDKNRREIGEEGLIKLKELCCKAEQDYEDMKLQFEYSQQIYAETLSYYHYEASKESGSSDLDPFFSLIADFVVKFKRANEENKKREEQKRMKQKREETKKRIEANKA